MIVIDKTKKKISEAFFGTEDLVLRELDAGGVRMMFCFLDGLTDRQQLEASVIRPIVKSGEGVGSDIKSLENTIIAEFAVEVKNTFAAAMSAIASGDCLLVVDGAADYFVLPVKKPAIRAVTEPPTSSVLKGPREGFVEDVKTNMILLRRRLATPKLVFQSITAGRLTSTSVVLAYLEGTVNKTVLAEVQKRLQSIDVDGIVDSSYISNYLETRPYSIFKQIGSQEKPDIVVAKLLEGRVALLVDGSPIVLTVPFILMEDFQSSEDYYNRTVRTSMLRIIRLMALFFALLLPAIAVALQQHQFQMLPLKLLMTIISSVDGIPFSPLIEMVLALVLFEILNEASIRMPRYVGMAMSVVGAIVLGETAVKAGILSSLSVLVTALSAIGLYVIPDEVGTFGILRMFYVLMAGILGLYGVVMAGLATAVYLVNFESFGCPYLAPLAPIVWEDMQDAIIKKSQKDLKMRPQIFGSPNRRRQK